MDGPPQDGLEKALFEALMMHERSRQKKIAISSSLIGVFGSLSTESADYSKNIGELIRDILKEN